MSAESELIEEIARCSSDPLRFVMFAFPWGSGELAEHSGPDEWQRSILVEIGERLQAGAINVTQAIQIAVASGHGIGKLLGYGDIVPTPHGMTRWGDLKVGDMVFGVDGSPTKILQCHHYSNVPMMRVTFDDRSSLDVSTGHLWTVRGRQERRNGSKEWRTLETAELAKLGVKRPNGITQARQWEIPIQGAAEFEDRETPIHPYLMGVWLGDGTKGEPEYTKPFDEIADKIRSLGYEVSGYADGNHKRILGCVKLFKDGVFECSSHERYIPDEYKYNSVSARMALFEGLCDTDGEVHRSGSIGYSTTSRKLAEDVLWLARSLGCKAMMQPTVKKGWYPDGNGGRVECRDCYRVTINAPFNPFTIEHRRMSYKPSEARYLTRWIDSIEPIEPQDGMCITVANEDGLYLANDFIVTHNSALVSWLMLWALSTFEDTRGVVTANTDAQLRTKTWAELAKWYRRCICSHWFEFTATALYARDDKHAKTWRIDMVPWSERNTEAFAGLHNQGKRVLLVFDEASAIPDIIWETAEGALTDKDTQIIWAVFGNPTRNTGRFRQCFGSFKHRWLNRQIDSRTVKITNKEQLAQWVADYGEDSDFVRVRVRGVFPRAGSTQFIGSDIVEAAASREAHAGIYDALVLGVDPARFGDDESVIYIRKGRDGRTHPPLKYRGLDNMQLAARVAEQYEYYRADAIFVDGGGTGSGVVDRLRQLRIPVIEVQFGASADRSQPGQEAVAYANKAAEMWGVMRDWLKTGGAIPDDNDLKSQLESREYGYVLKDGRDAIMLEKKADMKKRGLSSPDIADALALTFSYPVQPNAHAGRAAAFNKPRIEHDYDPFQNA